MCYQLLELLTFSLSSTWFVLSSVGRWRDSKMYPYLSMPFTLVMDEDSPLLTAELSGCVNLLGPLVVWESLSIYLWVKLLLESVGIGIVDDPVGFLLRSELGLSLGDPLDSETWPSVGLQLILDIFHGSKVSCHELVVSPLQFKYGVSPSGYFPNLLPPPSGTCPTSPLRATIAVILSGAWRTLTRWRG